MERESIKKANEILKSIQKNEAAIEILKYYEESGATLYTENDCRTNVFGCLKIPQPVSLDAWEVRLILRNKERRLRDLENQLERM